MNIAMLSAYLKLLTFCPLTLTALYNVDGAIFRLDALIGTVLSSLLLVMCINSADTVDYKMLKCVDDTDLPVGF